METENALAGENDLAHRHGGGGKLAAESAADKVSQNAASGENPAVFGAAPCSAFVARK